MGRKKSTNKRRKPPPKPLHGLVGVILVSLAAIPACLLLSGASKMQEPSFVFLTGVGLCFISIPIVAKFTFLRTATHVAPNEMPFLYMFIIFAFTAVVDFLISLDLFGYTDIVLFYLVHGEPYLKTSFGAFINFWDGTFHYALYLYMAYCALSGKGFRKIGLLWSGSIINSLIVLLSGAVVGQFGTSVKWSILLNVPYVVGPIAYLIKELSGSWKVTYRKQSQHSLLISVDCVIMLLCCAAFGLSCVRGLAVLGSNVAPANYWIANVEPYLLDPSGFAKMQILTHLFYFSPFNIIVAYRLIHRLDMTVLSAASIVFLGATLQSLISYVGPSLYNIQTFPEKAWNYPPSIPLFCVANFGMLFCQLLITIRCQLSTESVHLKIKST